MSASGKLDPVTSARPHVTEKSESQPVEYAAKVAGISSPSDDKCGDGLPSKAEPKSMLKEDGEVPVRSKCVGCGRHDVQLMQCKRCHAGRYCSKDCQKKCWQDHEILCDNIVGLESHLKENMFSRISYISSTSFTPKEELKMAKLIGRKCEVECALDGKKTKTLLDLGAQVAMISNLWLRENFPDKQIQPVSKLLGDHELVLTAANNSGLDYRGYVELQFDLGGECLLVPFLVSGEDLEVPIIGSNVLEEWVKLVNEKQDPEKSNGERAGPSIVDIVAVSLGEVEKNKRKAESLVNILQVKANRTEPESLGNVNVGGKDVVIPKGQNLKLKCTARCGPIGGDTAVLFQPNLDMDLESGLVLGEGIVMLEGEKKL